MRAASPHIEHSGPQGVHRAGRNARLADTVVARMAGSNGARLRQGPVKAERAAVAVPQPIPWVDQYAEWRSLQAFGAHRPLLEGLPRRIRWEIGRGADILGDGSDHPLRPIVEGIGAAAIRRACTPARERLPDRAADIADEHDACRGRATRQPGRRLPRLEIHRAAQK